MLAYRSKVDKGSAEEEKIDAVLNSSVSSYSFLQQSQETVLTIPSSIYSQGLDGVTVC